MKTMRQILAGAIPFAFALLAFGAQDVYQLALPTDVSLGASIEELRTKAPRAKDLGVAASMPHSSASNLLVLTETTSEAGRLRTRQSYVVEAKLRAVMTSSYQAAGRTEDAEANAIAAALATTFKKVRDEKILRMSKGMQRSEVTAELWRDEKASVDAYFVATTEETTLVLFDPRFFSGRDFFLKPSDLSEEVTTAIGRGRTDEKKPAETKTPVTDLPRSTKN